MADDIKTIKNKKTSTLELDPDYRGLLSPFRLQVDRPSAGSINTNKNVFSITDYRWYPDGLEEYLNSDIYHVGNDLLNENDIGIFGGISISDVSSIGGISNVINKSASYAVNQFKGVIDSVGGLFGNNEQAGEPYNPINEYIKNVPTVKVYEFQPNNSISELGNLFKDTFKLFDEFFKDKGSRNQKIENLKGLFTSDGMGELLEKITGRSIEEINSDLGSVKSIPNFFYSNIIGGFYTARYDMPFYNQEGFLHGMGDVGWEARSLKQRLFPAGLAGMLDKFSDLASSFDIASKPKWSVDGSGPASDSVTFEFMLYNVTSDDLVNNLAFVHSLSSGNMWVQKQFKQLSSCLYDIEVEGRYRYYFCKADIKIEYSGKERIITDDVLGIIKAHFGNNSQIVLNDNAIRRQPDAFKVIITFQSLIPNNFNSYLNYISNDSNNVSVGKEIESVGIKMATSIGEIINRTTDDNLKVDNNDTSGALDVK
jgi:hypothetical protein